LDENSGQGPRRRYIKRPTAQARANSQAVITKGGTIVWLALADCSGGVMGQLEL
jgi:hypothetical protein